MFDLFAQLSGTRVCVRSAVVLIAIASGQSGFAEQASSAGTSKILPYVGEWAGDPALNASALSGGLIPAGEVRLSVARAGDTIVVARTMGANTTSLSYNLDGSEAKTQVKGQPATTKLLWIGEALILEVRTKSGLQSSRLTLQSDRLKVTTTIGQSKPIDLSLFYNRSRLPPSVGLH